MKWIETVHDRRVASRRARILSQHLAETMPSDATVLDVGCGDGEIAHQLSESRGDLTVTGVDVLVRDETLVPVTQFDGRELPFADSSFDVITFVDVLHHCDWPLDLLREACRVSRRWIVIKDHTLQGIAAQSTLRFMDWVGNHRHGVALPYNYWRWAQWRHAFQQLDLRLDLCRPSLGLYWWPFSCVFDRQLHFLARVEKA